MVQPQPLSRRDHLTFKGNLRNTRHGWLRLTPAYSIHLVAELLEKHAAADAVVLDPFCGTGTTSLVCAERGIHCDTTDINPFLLWLARVKATTYSTTDLKAFRDKASEVATAIRGANGSAQWTPPLRQIEKWWSASTLAALGRAMGMIRQTAKNAPAPAVDLLRVAFSQTMIERANVSFGHQSMSFKKPDDRALSLPLEESDEGDVAAAWDRRVATIVEAARSEIRVRPSPVLCDARDLRTALASNRYDCVITSPPYPNRMSYIRELRPYMYWLGYLKDGREAGELDWQAIGGTWGCATSNVSKWMPDRPVEIPFDGFDAITASIKGKSGVLGRYVEKYFHDMVRHCESLFDVVAPGGTVHYIVGNSKFYEVMLPVERIFAAMFQAVGFEATTVETIRKRTSKKELFEFAVSARKPAGGTSAARPKLGQRI
jgi:DNA modification methylase